MTGSQLAEPRNRGCFCITLDRPALMAALNKEVDSSDFAQRLDESHPSLFSNVATFVTSANLVEMKQVVDAVEAAARLPGYREAVLTWAPPIACRDFGPIGALMGYDFHVTADGPKLIEINTNAGGAFLVARLAIAQRACCADARASYDLTPAPDFDSRIVDMFIDEWRRQRGGGRPKTIAIVDDAPNDQYLFPEFRLGKALLEKHGFEATIADPAELSLTGETLQCHGRTIDLVYNRLVDFALEAPRHAALRAAYLGGLVVVTPNPRAHVLFADKRDLTLLSNPEQLHEWGLSKLPLEILSVAVPKTVMICEGNADALWRDRKDLFFKPAGGYGGKAVYRGSKVTRKVWAEIIAGDYIAQAYAAPSTRGVQIDATRTELKVDVRLYTFDGSIVLTAARLYQGQTTNMRTIGGGFAPLLQLRQ